MTLETPLVLYHRNRTSDTIQKSILLGQINKLLEDKIREKVSKATFYKDKNVTDKMFSSIEDVAFKMGWPVKLLEDPMRLEFDLEVIYKRYDS